MMSSKDHLAAIESDVPAKKYIIEVKTFSYTDFFNTAGFHLETGSGTSGWQAGWLFCTVQGIFCILRLRRREPEFTGKGVGHIYCNKTFPAKSHCRTGIPDYTFPGAANINHIRFLGNQ